MKITYKLNCKSKYDYDTCSPYRVVLKPGKYKFDCFGGSSAKGKNDDSSLTGYGAHVSGVIKLFREKTFYIYVGGQGETELIGYESVISHGGYNGGGNGGSSAYDIYD